MATRSWEPKGRTRFYTWNQFGLKKLESGTKESCAKLIEWIKGASYDVTDDGITRAQTEFLRACPDAAVYGLWENLKSCWTDFCSHLKAMGGARKRKLSPAKSCHDLVKAVEALGPHEFRRFLQFKQDMKIARDVSAKYLRSIHRLQ